MNSAKKIQACEYFFYAKGQLVMGYVCTYMIQFTQ